MSVVHTEEQQPSTQAEVLTVPVTLHDVLQRAQSSLTPLTVTAVPLPQQLMHDKHPILLDSTQQNEIPMDPSTFTNQTSPADCETTAASTNSVVHDSKPLVSSSQLKLSRPQSSFKLSSLNSLNRLVSKSATITPIATSSSSILNSSAKKLVSEDETRLQDVCSNNANMSQDLNRCLQEAVESLFSPSSPATSTASYKSTANDEDDVTFVKVPVLSVTGTSTVQKEQFAKIDPDDVKIELVRHDASHVPLLLTGKPIKGHISTLEPHRAQPDSIKSCPIVVPEKQSNSILKKIQINAGETSLMPVDDTPVQIKTQAPEADGNSLTEAASLMSLTDEQPIIETTTLPPPVDVKSADSHNRLDEKDELKTKLHQITTAIENPTTDRPDESVTTEEDVKSESSALSDEASEPLINCSTVTKPIPKIPAKFSVNEYGLEELDTDSKESAKSECSEKKEDSSEPSKLKETEEQTRASSTKSKIGILCKRGKNSDKKIRIKNKNIVPDFLNNIELVATKKNIKKKIKSPILKPEENMDSMANDTIKPADDIYNCKSCGCYGLEVEFLNSHFCSTTCEEDWTLKIEEEIKKEKERTQVQLKRRKKKLLEKVHHEIELQRLQEEAEKELQLSLEFAPKPDPEPSAPIISEQSPESNISKEETWNDDSQDLMKPRLPWQTGKHGFSWTKYLEYNKAKPAPVKLFKDPFPYSKNNFKVGMKLEGIDPKHPNHFCVLSVAEVCGYRLKLHFDGYSSLYDFWINADSMDIFPAGWCEKNGYLLHSPPNYDQQVFSWSEYLKHCRAPPAPKSLFYNKTGDTICPNGFRIGMKLEAVDRQNTSLVCVATVVGLMDSRIMVHFDGWDDIYNYWADPSSSYIHPVGWCEEHGHKLTPPSDWDSSDFTWEKYLQETKSTAAPARAFKQRIHGGFKRGLKLECVDKRMPMAVRVATVDDIREHQIRVKFDGWSDIYSYWVDEDSRDIHPMGWCQTVGHVLELPLTSDDYTQECPTPGCQGQGHVTGSKHLTNHTVPGCPFDPQILIKKEEITDRLSSTPESPIVQVQIKEKRLSETKNPVGRPAKWRRLEGSERGSVDSQNDIQEKTDFTIEKKRRKRKINKAFTPSKKVDINLVSQELRQAVLNPGYKPCGPEESEHWLKHSYPLNVYISSVSSESDFTNWNESHVIELITSILSTSGISDSNNLIDIFRKQGIDGEAFSMMTQDDLVSSMGIKIGPALKIFNCIMLLRQKVKQSKANIF